MGKSRPALSRELVERVTSEAEKASKLISDREKIYELSLRDKVTLEARGTGNALNSYGSLSFISKKTSRSAAMTEIFFGEPDERQEKIMRAAAEYLEGRIRAGGSLLVMDKLMGLHPEHRHHCRTIVTSDYARMLVMWDKLIFDLPAEMEGKEPEQIEILVPEWDMVAREKGLPPVSILVDAVNGVTIALGSDYFGEVKKGHLRMAMYTEKLKYLSGEGGGLGVHAGGKVIRAKDASSGRVEDKGALFFGLSGTGKTTLSVHHFWLDPAQGETVIIRQDDFFVLTDKAEAFGTEDNAYIKTEGLEPDGQPLLYAGATSPKAVLENVYVDPGTLEPDFFRYDHFCVPGGKCFNGRGIVIRRELDFTDDRIDLDRVDMIFFITRRETVIPPVMKLDTEQAAAAFMLGESILTSAADPTKAGQSVLEVGTNPFIVGSGGQEGNIFYDILKKNPHIQCFLFNTGGFGGRNEDVSSESLGAPGAMEKLRDYLAGAPHEDKGKTVERKLQDGTSAEFRISQVRFEIEDGGGRHRLKKEIDGIFGKIESGESDPSDYRLVRVNVLAGQKVKIKDSAAFIREIARGTIEWKKEEYWGCQVPVSVEGVDMSRFDERRFYSDGEIRERKDAFRAERKAWLHKFEDLDPVIRNLYG